ncbi:hypothetical protein Tco_1215968 [Tanacetum coccineum]
MWSDPLLDRRATEYNMILDGGAYVWNKGNKKYNKYKDGTLCNGMKEWAYVIMGWFKKEVFRVCEGYNHLFGKKGKQIIRKDVLYEVWYGSVIWRSVGVFKTSCTYSKRSAFWSLNEDILKITVSEDQYVVSIKEDTAYPCLNSPKTTKGMKINTPYPEDSICCIKDMESI